MTREPVLVIGTSATYSPDAAAEFRAKAEEIVGCKVVVVTQCTALLLIPGDDQ